MGEDYVENAAIAEQRYYNQHGWDQKPEEIKENIQKLPEIERLTYYQQLQKAADHSPSTDGFNPTRYIPEDIPLIIVNKFKKENNLVLTDDLRDFPMLLSVTKDVLIQRNRIHETMNGYDAMKYLQQLNEDIRYSLEHEQEHYALMAGNVLNDEGEQKRDTDSIKFGVGIFYIKGKDSHTEGKYVFRPFIGFEGRMALESKIESLINPRNSSSGDVPQLKKIEDSLRKQGVIFEQESIYRLEDRYKIYERIENQSVTIT